MQYEFTVEPLSEGERLDVWLARLDQVGSRTAAQRLIAAGAVRLDGRKSQKSVIVNGGERVTIVQQQATQQAESGTPAVPFTIVFEDDSLLVIDKPAGLVVHPAAAHPTGTLSQALAGKAGGGDSGRPGIVHRIDRETSGLLVVAKNDDALRALQGSLRRREMHREYLALVVGHPEAASGTIDAPLGRDRLHRELISTRTDTPRSAITHFKVEQTMPACTLLRVNLDTGRTHQIRVHLAAIGLPVGGDRQYGVADYLGLSRQFLHACKLSFPHPNTGDLVSFESALPEDLAQALKQAQSATG